MGKGGLTAYSWQGLLQRLPCCRQSLPGKTEFDATGDLS
jgi:hypothetical protein